MVRALATTVFIVLTIGAADGQRSRSRSSPSLGGMASRGSNSEESLGSQLLSAVLSNDLEAAGSIFAGVSSSQAVRLANAIDWRGKSVLMHAASRDLADMGKLLVSHKARVDASDYTGGATALMLAARNGSLAAVEMLIEAGAKVNATTPQGTTVLMQVCAPAAVDHPNPSPVIAVSHDPSLLRILHPAAACLSAPHRPPASCCPIAPPTSSSHARICATSSSRARMCATRARRGCVFDCLCVFGDRRRLWPTAPCRSPPRF